MTSEQEGGPLREGRPRERAAAKRTQREDNPGGGGQDVENALAEIRRWERASRIVADDTALSRNRKCFALRDMMARARRTELQPALGSECHPHSRRRGRREPQTPFDVRLNLRTQHPAPR